ncbi:MAG TPA: LamG-like jellyroll fold domain-containing protein [Jiangellaceae bacterium]
MDQAGPGFPPDPDGQPDWQHLAAVYDSAAEEVRLYVDGNLAATQAYTYGPTVDGSLRLGRGQTGDGFTGDASGRVDDAIAAGFAMSASDIRRIKSAETIDQVTQP